MDRPTRIGVIGAGIMGEQYVRIFQAHPQAEVAALASRTRANAEAVAARHQVAAVRDDWRELIDDPTLDAIVVATPDELHFSPAAAAIQAGKHVLIEKPMTTDLDEADRLLALARASSVKVQVAYNHRWLAPYYQGRQAIARGAIGQPLVAYARKNDTLFVPTEYINWAHRTTPAWFLSCHDIDLVRWFFNAEPVEARAWGVKQVLVARGIDTYDMIQSQVRFANGAIATFECGWIYPKPFPTMVDSFVEVIGERGHLHFDRKRESIELSTEEAFSYPKAFLSADVFGTLRGAFPNCLSDFVRSIREDIAPGVGALDGRQATAVLDAIHRSLAADGATIPIAPIPSAS